MVAKSEPRGARTHLLAIAIAIALSASCTPFGEGSSEAPTADGGACGAGVDFATDASHCGRCGHSCLGGACANRTCAPTVFVPAVVAADLVVVGDSLYWATLEAIFRQGLGDSGRPEHVIDARDVSALASDGTHLFWTERRTLGAVRTCSVDGCAGSARDLAAGEIMATSLAVDDSGVYWTTTPEGRGAVRRADKDGANVGTLASGEEFPRFAVTDRDHVYWLSTCDVRYVRKGGGAATALAGLDACSACGLAIDGDGALYATAEGTSVLARFAPRGSVVRLTAGVASPASPVVDGDSIYWLNHGETPPTSAGGVMRLARSAFGASARPELLAPMRGVHGRRLRVGRDSLFYTAVDGSSYSIYRLAK